MKQTIENDILFDDSILIEMSLGKEHLNNSTVNDNCDCSNNIYNLKKDEILSSHKSA